MSKIKKKYIYKICTISEWNSASLNGYYLGSKLDLSDKFIHFSTAQQIEETLRLHFDKINNLCLLKVSTEGLNIIWEKSRNNQLFPHLYNTLDTKKVIEVINILKDKSGSFNITNLKLE